MEHTRSRVMIAILDSCRENPLPWEYRAVVAGAGLASVNASAGTLIEYATAPNKAAIDSIGGNHSPYTGALLNHLAQPDTEIEHVFKLVREDVVKLTNGAQVPWESSSITSDVFLNQAKVSNLVQGFWFNYNFPPVGRRVWSMTSPNTWIEQYDNGDQTQFNAISRTTIDGDNGVVVRRIDNEPFDPTVREGSAEVFIPDRQSKLMWTRFRSYESGQWSNWTYINEMKDVH